MASTPVPPDPAAFVGAWTLRAAGQPTGCRLVLRSEPASRPPRIGHALQVSQACAARLSLAPTLWRPEVGGLVVEGADARDALLFSQEDGGRYVARGRDGRALYTLTRAAGRPR